jgi:hypothetical protein
MSRGNIASADATNRTPMNSYLRDAALFEELNYSVTVCS